MIRRKPGKQDAAESPIDIATGWLRSARRVESPNRDARPADARTNLIVIHGISLPPGEFGGPWIDRLFTNTLPPEEHPYFATIADRQVSAHLLIDRHGRITQYVPFQERAWHAGPSSYEGRTACNDFSIGIELEGTDTTPYEDAQYVALARIVCALTETLSGFESFQARSTQRHRSRAQDRSGTELRLAAPEDPDRARAELESWLLRVDP